MSNRGVLVGLVFLALASLSVGCGPTEQAEDPQILALRAKYVLAEAPQGAMSVVAAKAAVEKGEPVVLVGLVCEPWDEGRAAFHITDAFASEMAGHSHDREAKHDHDAGDDHDAGHDHDAASVDEDEADEHAHGDVGHEGHGHVAHGARGHDSSNCPFCSREKDSKNLLAVIEFLDEEGKRLSIDARKLLGVKEDQLVIVRGRGKIDSLGYLVISADGICLRD